MMHWTRGAMVSALVVLGAIAGSGCGGDSAAVASCKAACDAQSGASGCTNIGEYVSLCKTVCEAVVSHFSGECQSQAEAVYDCQQRQTYSCSGGGNYPQPDDSQACAAELQAFKPCGTLQQ